MFNAVSKNGILMFNHREGSFLNSLKYNLIINKKKRFSEITFNILNSLIP